jgi:hypothetical protein
MLPFTVRILVAVGIGASFAIMGNMLAYVIVGRINERVPESERVSYLKWDLRIRKKHREIYPDSKLVSLFDLCCILMVLSFLFVMWSI